MADFELEKSNFWPSRIPYLFLGIGLIIAFYMVALEMKAGDDYDRRLERQNRVQYVTDIRQCRRANVQNAFIRIRDEGKPFGKKYFAILDCEASSKDPEGRGVPMPRPEQEKYIRILRDGYLPLVNNGNVVGMEKFPEGGPNGLPYAQHKRMYGVG